MIDVIRSSWAIEVETVTFRTANVIVILRFTEQFEVPDVNCDVELEGRHSFLLN